jgi:hypothetical protein
MLVIMIVSERGIEYRFAASIHPSDFSVPAIKQRVQAAAPELFKELPQPNSSAASTLQSDLTKTGRWYLRRNTRLEPNIRDFLSLDEWLSFLKSPSGVEAAGGAISRYISVDELRAAQPDFQGLIKELATVFSETMAEIVAPAPPSNPVQRDLEDFLATYASTRSTVTFGQHD